MDPPAVVGVVVLIVMTLRARLERGIQRTEGFSSMFGVAGRASKASRAMGRNDTRHEAFGLMAVGTFGVHLLPVLCAYANRVTGRARIAIRSPGN